MDPKPRPSQTLSDATSSSRLDILGTSVLHRSDHEHRNSSKHRHTQSDVHGSSFRSHRRDKSDGLPHLRTGIAAERARKAEKAKLPNELWGVRTDELRRIATNRSDRGRNGEPNIERAAQLRRTNSDPKRQTQQTRKSNIEMLLDGAEAKKMAKKAAVSQKDVNRLQKTTSDAEKELQGRLAAVNKISVDITRRLDYTYYNLLEKVGNMVAIVQSFHSLSSQTKDMVDNFAKEASELERDVKLKVERLKTSFGEKETRVKRLEDRGARANAKAQDLDTRLKNARQRVEAWEKREGAERRRRSWFWKSTWTMVMVALIVIFVGFTWRKWQSEADIVRMALMDDNGGFGPVNQNMLLDGDLLRRMKLPDDVKGVLNSIVERRSQTVESPAATVAVIKSATHQEEDERLRALDEL